MPILEPRTLSLNEAASYVADRCDVSIEEAKAVLDRAFREYSLRVYSDRFEQVQGWQGAEIDWDNSAVVGGEHLTINGVRYPVRVNVLRQHLDEWMGIDESVGKAAAQARADREYQNPDWSLGNVLSWITFRDRSLICQFERRSRVWSYEFYKNRGSGPAKRPMLVPRPDQVLLNALKDGQLTAISNGTEIPSSFWFGKYTSHLPDDLHFRRVEAFKCWPEMTIHTAPVPPQAQTLSEPNVHGEGFPEGPDALVSGHELVLQSEENRRLIKWRREKWRGEWITNFAARQRLARRWISFVDLADWCAQSTTAASLDEEAKAREVAYRRLADSVRRGEFQRDTRSKVLYLDPHVTPDGASPKCRLTRGQFETAFEAAAMPPAASLPLPVLGCCWLPYALVRDWLASHGYRCARHFEAAPAKVAPRLTESSDVRVGRIKRRPPSREKEFWPAVREAAMEWLTDNGCPAPNDGNQAALEKHVTEWLEDHRHEASESAVRRHVVRWIKEFRQEL